MVTPTTQNHRSMIISFSQVAQYRLSIYIRTGENVCYWVLACVFVKTVLNLGFHVVVGLHTARHRNVLRGHCFYHFSN